MPSREEIQKIVNYLKQETAVGYDIATLRNYLISQGYSQELVDSAIDAFYGKAKGKGFRILDKIKYFIQSQKRILFFSTLSILIIGIILIAFLFVGETQKKEEVRNVSEAIIIEERPAIDTDLFADQRQGLKVAEEDTKKDKAISAAEKIEDIAVEKIRETTLKEELKSIEDLDDALKFCEREEVDPDECYSAVAEKFEKAEICTKIEKTLKKETCIIALSYSSDGYQYCGEIENPTTQRLCRNIGRNQVRGEAALLSSEDIVIREANEEEINQSEVIVYIVEEGEFNSSG